MNNAPNSASDDSMERKFAIKELLSRVPKAHWYQSTEKKINASYQYANLFGFLNPIRATPIQLIDKQTIEWLYSLSDTALREALCFDPQHSSATIMCDGLSPNPSIIEVCKQHDIALLRTPSSASAMLDFLQADLPKLLSARSTKHGVFLAVMNTGVLITGASGVGKSEVALDLVQRGHQLIADDAVEFYRRDGVELIGECSEALKGYLEIRGLGIINIDKMFGPSSVLDSYPLQLMINLRDASNKEIRDLDRLQPSMNAVQILGVEIQCLNMLVAPGRNLSVLVEAAIRDHLLRLSGVDSSLEFMNRHEELMRAERSPCEVTRN